MATTVTSVVSHRSAGRQTVSGTVSSVPIDAQIAELFTLPAGYGDLLLESVQLTVDAVSADLVTVATLEEAIQFRILSGDGASVIDIPGTARLYAAGDTAARPMGSAFIHMPRQTLWRRQELFACIGPILAGAGATATLIFHARGLRIESA